MIDALLIAGLLAASPDPGAPAAGPAPEAVPPGAPAGGAAVPAQQVFDDAWVDPALAPWPAPSPRPAGPPGRPGSEAGAWLRRSAALAVDALPSARALRQPLPVRPAVPWTLDGATAAEKGPAVLAMAAAYLGADRWRAVLDAVRVVQPGAPTAGPLLSALSAAAGSEVAEALRGFLEEPGAPVLALSVRCERDRARALVSQAWLAPTRAPPPGFTVPVCLRAGGPRGEVTVCALAAGPEAAVDLPFCPAWLWPNAGGAGYYVTALAGPDLRRLWPHLSADEQLAAAVDAALRVRRGGLPLEEGLALVAPLASQGDARQVAAALLLAGLLEPRWLPDGEQVRWRAYLRRTFGARARGLGWLPRPDDGEAERALRPVLLPLLAGEGEEAVLAGEALALARRWLADRRQVPAEVAWPALRAAAYHGDQGLFDAIGAEAGRAEPPERGQLLALLGRFREGALAAAALAVAADPATAPGDAAGLLSEALAGRATRPAALAALRAGWDGLAPRLGRDEAARLVEAAARTACQPAARAEVAAFLEPRVAALDGAPRTLALALEEADACLAARARGAAAAARVLARR